MAEVWIVALTFDGDAEPALYVHATREGAIATAKRVADENYDEDEEDGLATEHAEAIDAFMGDGDNLCIALSEDRALTLSCVELEA